MNATEREIIRQRVAAAKLATEVAEMVRGDLPSLPAARRFVEQLHEELLGTKPTNVSGKGNPEIPLERLGAFRMPFGRYVDHPLSEIPLDYLDWLVGAQEDVLTEVRAFLAHPEIKKQLQGDVAHE